MKTVSVQELKKKIEEEEAHHILVDVREAFEHKSESIPVAENIPEESLGTVVDRLKEAGTVYVHCRTGGRSLRVCKLLEEKGVNVVNVEGGIEAWKEAGFQVEGKGGPLPMMRQVMISAGSLVLISMVLGVYVNVWWYGLAGFIGAGLLFAGVTGWCGMTHILKLMPWNRVS